MKISLILLSLFITIINSGCHRSCVEANFSFSIDSQINPDIDSIKIGDTLYLTSSFSTTLTDLSSNKLVDYSNSTGIGSDIHVSKFEPADTSTKDAVFDFDYISVTGQIYNDRNIPSADGVQQLTYQQTNGNYELKVGFIAKKTGDYILGLGNGFSNGLNGNRRCDKATFSISIYNTN